ncbi:hypothetical protein QE152_g15240 [Popillia japonica]|uniref:Uncharacterized protein n=1 Tax=Popillia japonica TaxID=7064 RepID=A0AAW1L900_POPJA
MNYEGIKKNLKKKYAANKFEIYKTGGGEAATVEYTSFELKLISILSINIKGLMCNVDSDTFITNTETEEPQYYRDENRNTVIFSEVAMSTNANIQDHNKINMELNTVDMSELELDQVPLENNIAGSIEAEVPIVKADGRSELLRQQLIIADKESKIKDLEIEIKERQLEHMEKEHKLKIKILEQEYNI